MHARVCGTTQAKNKLQPAICPLGVSDSLFNGGGGVGLLYCACFRLGFQMSYLTNTEEEAWDYCAVRALT